MDFSLFLISVIEGITEFLPISSTAHLIILSKILSVDLSSPFIKFYLLSIQFGALLAGIVLFTKKLILDRKLFLNVFISFLPSLIFGFLLYKSFKHLLEGNFVLISMMLFIGGIIFILIEKNTEQKAHKDELSYLDAFWVGIAQSVAIIPGVSRSGATIIAGILRGIKKEIIIEYTFLLAIPTIFSAVVYDTYKSINFIVSNSVDTIIYGGLIAFVSSFITLYLVKKYLPKISLLYFGIYRIIISLVILLAYLS